MCVWGGGGGGVGGGSYSLTFSVSFDTPRSKFIGFRPLKLSGFVLEE